jgi:GSCFA family
VSIYNINVIKTISNLSIYPITSLIDVEIFNFTSMQFRSEVPVKKQESTIGLGDRFVTIGSCFANSIHQKLVQNKFNSLTNPLGIIYDPRSIARVINFALTGNRPDNQTYINTGGQYVNLLAHSDMNGNSLAESEERINNKLIKLQKELKTANWLILTLGTSWVYYQNSTGLQVANCHKIPQKEFVKGLLEFERTKLVYDNLLQFLKEFNPGLKVILTVSPVRHIKDTLALNNLSKAHLFMLCHYLDNTYAHVQYYPAYELLVDDLRDYRFYKSDLIHPTDQAIEYIWDHFTNSYFNSGSLSFLKEWNSIQKDLRHKPFDQNSEKHQKFIKSTIAKLEALSEKVDTNFEIEDLKNQLLPAK